MTVNALGNSLLWECTVACCVKAPGDTNPHGICSSFCKIFSSSRRCLGNGRKASVPPHGCPTDSTPHVSLPA